MYVKQNQHIALEIKFTIVLILTIDACDERNGSGELLPGQFSC